MCLPFNCGGGGQGDHGSPVHQGILQHHLPQPPPTLSPAPRYDQEDVQAYKPIVVSPIKEPYGHHAPAMAAGGEGRKGGAAYAAPRHAAGVNKNGERMAAFDNSDADVPASDAGVVRGRRSAAEKNVAPALAAQAPHQHGSVVASHPKEAADKMRAPPVIEMARRRGGEDDYPTAAAATPTPAANNFYGDRDYDDDHAYGHRDDRKPKGNTWW